MEKNDISVSDLFDSDVDEKIEKEAAIAVEKPVGDKEEVTKTALDLYLESYHVKDKMLSFEDETGTIVNKNFDELPVEEQFTILTELAQSQIPNIEPADLKILNELYTQGISLQEYLSTNNQEAVVYTVDDFNDEDLFKFDLKEKVPDITDEDLEAEYKSAKDSKFFVKNMETLRATYKDIETRHNYQKELAEEQKAKEEYEKERLLITNVTNNLKNIHGFPVNDGHRQQINELLTTVNNKTGTSFFIEEISKPENMVNIAWYLSYGDEAFNQLATYYKKQVTEAYNRGKAEATDNFPGAPIAKKSHLITNKDKKQSTTIQDLYNE